MRSLLAVTLIAGLLVAAGCGTKTVTDTGPNGQVTTRTVKDISFAKTKFLLHSGLAFGAFHRYILKPFRAGSFKKGASGQKKAIAKAAVAGLFAYHELKVAREDALASDVLRRRIVQPIDALIAKLKTVAASLKGGSLHPGDILGAAGAIGGITSLAKGAGFNIKDRNGPIPGI